jgi:putative pyoverdin transport system ATP-binding/permease protein
LFNLIKFLFKFSPKVVAIAILGGILSGISSAALIGIINSGINKPKEEKLTLLLAFVGLGLIMLISGIVSKISLILLAQSAVFELRLSLSKQIIEAPLKFLETYGGPRLIASLIDDVQIVAGTLLGVPALCINFATVLICLIYIGWLSLWVLGSVILFTVIGVLSYYTFLTRAWNYLRQAREIQNKLFADFRALTQGMKELKLNSSRRDAFFSEELEKTALTYRGFSTKGSQIYAGSDSWGQFLFITLMGLIIFVLPLLVQTDSGSLTGYVLALLYIMAPLEVMVNFFPNIGRAQIALQQIQSLGLTLSEEKKEKKAENNQSEIVFKELNLEQTVYHYLSDHEEKGFQIGPLDLTIKAGETVFLVGGNGSGKTTLLKLLTGLYLPDEGEITINGTKLSIENSNWYRSHFSAVFSDFYLFDKLLGLDNPLLDKTAADYLERLQLQEKVTITKGRFSTIDLSQGQRKRLALLTSFLENKDFYVFDEWAADQDPVFKNIFYKELLPELKAKGKTLLVITHDDRYFSLADRVIKLDYGQLEEINPKDFPSIEGSKTIKQLASTIKPNNAPELSLSLKNNPPNELKSNEGFPKDFFGAALLKGFLKDNLANNQESEGENRTLLLTLVSFLFFGVFGFISLTVLRTPQMVSPNHSTTEFSAERAFNHVQEIARKMHPVGTAENENVRNYILAVAQQLGLQSEIVEAETLEKIRDEIKGGTTKNILVKIPGTEGNHKIAFSSHYDSTPYSYGAADNGAAVGMMLETMRVIKTEKPLKNDLLFIFTDGEEETMLGGRGLRDSTGLYREIDLIFNFEARGTSGPSIMFETSSDNNWLIQNLSESGANILATSVSADLYELMPNLTDFTIFKENNLNGLNFAFIGNGDKYHSLLDNTENLSIESILYQGNCSLSLARHFGNLNVFKNNTGNSVYFSLPGFFVNYSESWVLPGTLFSLGLLAVVIFWGIKKKRLSGKGIILGFLSFIAILFISLILSLIIGFFAKLIFLSLGGKADEAKYTADYIVYGGALLAVGLHYVFCSGLWRKIYNLNLTVGILTGWCLILFAAVFLFPGGSYLFFWSVLGGLIACLILIFRKSPSITKLFEFTVMLLFSIPAILVIFPLIYLLSEAFGENSLSGVMVLITLLMTSMATLGLVIPNSMKKSIPAVFGLAALIFLIAGILPRNNTKQTPAYKNLFFAQNNNTRKAVWASADGNINEWTIQFLGEKPEKGKISEIFPSNYASFLYKPVQNIDIPSPDLQLIDEVNTPENRILKLKINSGGNSPVIYLFAPLENGIQKIKFKNAILNLNEYPLYAKDGYRKLLTYFAIPQKGLEFTVETAKNAKVTLLVTGQRYGLPDIFQQNKPVLPENIIFSDLMYNNSTLITKSFDF